MQESASIKVFSQLPLSTPAGFDSLLYEPIKTLWSVSKPITSRSVPKKVISSFLCGNELESELIRSFLPSKEVLKVIQLQ